MNSEDKLHDHLEITSKCDHDVLLKNEKEFKPIYLPISLLKAITKNFSDDLQIGNGGFAVVYKGLLKRGGTVAVKKLLNTICMDDDQFQKEVGCLMKVTHKNIVRFLGYCADTQSKMLECNRKFILADERQRLLCFEYLPNGSLEKYINDASAGLEWNKRYKIIKGICEGIHYLHENNIVHLDLKPANILLNDNMVAKISDFGLSRCFEEMQTRTVTSTLVGSMGYLAPEFFNGEITKKLDIYSLGVIVAELLTGQKGHAPVENVLECWRKRFGESSPDTDKLLEQIRVCAQIRMSCGNLDPAKRPDIQQINAVLNESSDDFPEVDFQEVFSSLAAMQNMEGMPTTTSRWWNSHISTKNSKWLANNLTEMDAEVKQMIKYVEADADSFARKAETYYKTRPLLMSHVENFYRRYRALAERYDHLTVEMRKSIPISLQSNGSGISESDSDNETEKLISPSWTRQSSHWRSLVRDRVDHGPSA